jgi:hypothetical protein
MTKNVTTLTEETFTVPAEHQENGDLVLNHVFNSGAKF